MATFHIQTEQIIWDAISALCLNLEKLFWWIRMLRNSEVTSVVVFFLRFLYYFKWIWSFSVHSYGKAEEIFAEHFKYITGAQIDIFDKHICICVVNYNESSDVTENWLRQMKGFEFEEMTDFLSGKLYSDSLLPGGPIPIEFIFVRGVEVY